MNLYSVSILMTVVANLSYHLCQKSIRPGVNPFVSLLATYFIALLCTVLLGAATLVVSPRGGVVAQLRELNWASYALGGAIVLLELGFLLAYRAGWNISLAALYSNVIVTVLLIPLGIILFHERLSWLNGLGIVCALVGILLMSIR